MVRRAIVQLTFFGSLGLALTACLVSSPSAIERAPALSPSEATRPMPLQVAGSGISGNMMTPWAAYEGGFFEKYGL